MSILFSLLTNPVTISVLVLCVLCLTGLNVLLSMLIACIIGGVAGGIPLLNAPEGTQTVMQLLTGGFASNATTALAYILLGTFASPRPVWPIFCRKSCRACSADTSWRSSVC